MPAIDRERSREACPVCGQASFKPVAPQGVLVNFAKDRECQECGSVWRPACPRPAALVFLLIGIAFLAGAFCIMHSDASKGTIGFPISVGGASLLYGVSALVGSARQVRIIKRR